MKKVTAVLLILLLLCATSAIAQEKLEPSAAAKATLLKLFQLSNQQALQSPVARNLLTGEALEWKMPGFGKLAPAPDRIVLLDDHNAVGRIQSLGRDDYVADLYFYLTLEDSWKVSAVRRLALTGIIDGAYQYLKSKPTLTAEEKEELGNFELLLAPDKALREWFGRNAARMNKLYEKSRGLKPGYVSEQRDPRSTEIKAQLKALNFATLEVHPDGNVEFVIGGVTDNTVGFLYSPGNQPPKMSPGSYIWIEEIAPKWFLFRTT